MMEVPAARPLAIPDEEPMLATEVFPLSQVPPDGVALSVVAAPWQRLKVEPTDVMEGRELTVMVFV